MHASRLNFKPFIYIAFVICLLGVQTNFIQQINSIVQALPCFQVGKTQHYIPCLGKTLTKFQTLFTSLCSNRAQWPLAPNFGSWLTKKSYFFYSNHMQGTLNFTVLEHWTPFNFPYSTALCLGKEVKIHNQPRSTSPYRPYHESYPTPHPIRSSYMTCSKLKESWYIKSIFFHNDQTTCCQVSYESIVNDTQSRKLVI